MQILSLFLFCFAFSASDIRLIAFLKCSELFALLLASKNFRLIPRIEYLFCIPHQKDILLIVILRGTRLEFVLLATPSKMRIYATHPVLMRFGSEPLVVLRASHAVGLSGGAP